MTKKGFYKMIDFMIEAYGVRSYQDNDDDEDLWFECPECGEPILYEDWKDDEELMNYHCPICEFYY